MGRLEVACFNATSALRAAAAGAHRIELCSDRPSGGITPPLALLQSLRSQISINIPINVMIRPRAGDFVYSECELKDMRTSIEAMKPHCSGFVFGVLKTNSRVDVEVCSRLVKLAEPWPCTFHRAFDQASMGMKPGEDVWLESLEDVINCGFQTILTSGRPGNAIDNVDALHSLLIATGRIHPPKTPTASLAKLISLSMVNKLVIMAGGGLRSKEIAALQHRGVDMDWYHTSGIIDDGEMADQDELCACRLQVDSGS